MKQTNERLCALAQKGDAAALDSLIDNNKSFIGKVANDLFRSMNLAQSGLNLDTDDLRHGRSETSGQLGLMESRAKVRCSAGHEVLDLCGSCHPQRHDGHGTECLYRF